MRIALLLLAALLAGCAASVDRAPATPAEASVTVPLSQAFAQPTRVSTGESRRVTIVPGRVPQVRVDDQDLLAVPVLLDGAAAATLIVRSHVMRLADGTHVLFYPVVSVVDDESRIVQTLKPRFQFAFEGTQLANEFALPPGTKRVLVHTDPQLIRERAGEGAFSGTTSRNPSVGGVPAAVGGTVGALGGVLGVLAVGVLAASAGESFDFTLGTVGIIELEPR